MFSNLANFNWPVAFVRNVDVELASPDQHIKTLYMQDTNKKRIFPSNMNVALTYGEENKGVHNYIHHVMSSYDL